MHCGRCERNGIVKCTGIMGNGLTSISNLSSRCFTICSPGLFTPHRKHGLRLIVSLSTEAPVDTILAGLNCKMMLFPPTARPRSCTSCKSRKLRRAMSHVSNWRLKKRISELSSKTISSPAFIFLRAISSMVRSLSLYKLLAFSFSTLSAASLLPSQRRQRYSSVKMRPSLNLRLKASPMA